MIRHTLPIVAYYAIVYIVYTLCIYHAAFMSTYMCHIVHYIQHCPHEYRMNYSAFGIIMPMSYPLSHLWNNAHMPSLVCT